MLLRTPSSTLFPYTTLFRSTASLRGSKGFSAFAGAKFALRALAQSMARELGPKGIHVAHPIIDGAIDTAFIRDNFPERYALKDQIGRATSELQSREKLVCRL